MKKSDLQFLTSTPQGRAVLWELLSFCGVYAAVDGSHDEMLLLEGKRRIGLQLMGNLVEHCEDEYFIMMKESKYKNQEKKDEQKINDARASAEYARGEAFDYDTHFGISEDGRHDSEAGLFI